jgi:hypothetical protein
VDWKRWVFPVVVGAALLGIAGVDLCRAIRAPTAGDVDVFASGELWFDPVNRLVDLRSEPASSGDVEVPPVHELVEGWGAAGPSGTWTDGPRAVLTMRLAVGGHRAILLQARAGPRKGPRAWLHVRVNRSRCRPVPLRRAVSVVRIEVPEGAIEPGENRFEFIVANDGTSGRPAPGRRLLVRRMVIAGEPDADFETAVFRRPVSLKRDRRTAVVRAPGRLWIRFDVPRPHSFLTVSCPFRGTPPGGDGRAGVARWFGSPAATDTIDEAVIRISGPKDSKLKFYLGNQTGPTVLWVDAVGVAPGAELLVVEPRVVCGP